MVWPVLAQCGRAQPSRSDAPAVGETRQHLHPDILFAGVAFEIDRIQSMQGVLQKARWNPGKAMNV